MKLVYTHDNRLLVSNIANILYNHHIQTMLKNVHASGGAGELAPTDTWPEVWVINDVDYEKASKIIHKISRQSIYPKWRCSYCLEINDATFDYCWNCRHEPCNDLP